jgi:hypothetical protein
MWKPLSLACFAGAVFATTAAASPDPETQRNIEGVRAVEAHWTRAFLGGDEAYLGRLLDPAYVSVNLSGVQRSKADIIALAKKIAAGAKQSVPTLPASHIDVRDDAAIVTVVADGQASVDVFYWKAGRWRAWYSQHTTVKTTG